MDDLLSYHVNMNDIINSCSGEIMIWCLRRLEKAASQSLHIRQMMLLSSCSSNLNHFFLCVKEICVRRHFYCYISGSHGCLGFISFLFNKSFGNHSMNSLWCMKDSCRSGACCFDSSVTRLGWAHVHTPKCHQCHLTAPPPPPPSE